MLCEHYEPNTVIKKVKVLKEHHQRKSGSEGLCKILQTLYGGNGYACGELLEQIENGMTGG